MARKSSKTQDGNVDTDDLLIRARKDYERCKEAWHENQEQSRRDLRFARLGEQWPAELEKERARTSRR